MDFPNPLQTDTEEIREQKEKIRQENVRREMARTSQDLILVDNPTDKDFAIEWDGYKHIVKAHSQRTLARYLALKYVKDMKDLMINEMANRKFEELMKERSKKGMVELTPFEKQEVWNRTYSTNDPTLIAKIYPQLWLGVAEEYGLDAVADDASQLRDFRSDEQKILDSLSKKRVSMPTETANEAVVPNGDLNQAKEKALKGVSA